MNNSWKLSILGAVALAASSAVAAVGCTVTSTTGPGDDGGIFEDGSTADGSAEASTDGGTGEAAADTGGGNTCQAQCAIIDKTQFGLTVGFDTDDAGNAVTCGSCDKCSAMNCCTEIGNCFNPVDGGESDCQSLFKCVTACSGPDAGDPAACKAACKAAYDVDGGNPTYDLLVAADNCQQTKCMTECQ
jgi:hypothetical protein